MLKRFKKLYFVNGVFKNVDVDTVVKYKRNTKVLNLYAD